MALQSMVRVEVPPHDAARSPASPSDTGRYVVYVVDWGRHTSIVLPQLPGWHIGPANAAESPWIEFAWGDRRYYMATDPGLLDGLRALFFSGSSAEYVQGWSGPPDPEAWRDAAIYARSVSGEQLALLAGELAASNGPATLLPRASAYPGRFYRNARRYSWWYDCNRSTVDRLEVAGLAHSARGVVFASQVAARLDGFTRLNPSAR